MTVTEMIRKQLELEGRSLVFLSRQLGTTRQNLHQRLLRDDLPVETVMRISEILKHDFFTDLSSELKNRQQINAPK
ncbi:MAG: hypothetical protein JST36_07640 [Bacteroidetes bacterium]|nr:hypothetical protein [Bacteroidota bacterium]